MHPEYIDSYQDREDVDRFWCLLDDVELASAFQNRRDVARILSEMADLVAASEAVNEALADNPDAAARYAAVSDQRKVIW